MIRKITWAALMLGIMMTGNASAQERILISSEWGTVTAILTENEASHSLLKQLPVTLTMRDHLRQEKTGTLPDPLNEVSRQLNFDIGTIGLWGDDHFVIYYRSGSVPRPGIAILGKVAGDVSIFDRPGPISVRLENIK